ncbi:hypothetical protein PLICRDRAFT_161633 [Plicaturopsis crispa FD-325 SS-3]|nr:hypothetical protein PLICRDRAFT_161633 [Plicaturopsis crispa FD-325 SS-3]
MSHALLLRLFLSPSFFSVHVALQYLRIYGDNIGITYYLTRRLREVDTGELQNVWGFICHLLVTRPSKSRALECFVVEVAQRSTHIAMVTLWFMQAALRDLAHAPHDSESFAICQRTLHCCHELIFGDLPPPTPTPYPSLSIPFHPRILRKKVKTQVEPALVGLGLILAGVPGMPKLTEVMGEVAIEQGRIDDDGHEFKSVEERDDENVRGTNLTETPRVSEDELQPDNTESPTEESPPSRALQMFPHSELVEVKPGLMARRGAIGAAQTSPALPLHLRNIRRPRLSEDPLGQLDSEPTIITTPFSSSPSISTSSRQPQRTGTYDAAAELLQRYDVQSQIDLLRSHYCRSEVQFILTLENISNRLLVVPRPARVSALRAELTALNHKLPAEVCMPMWCSSSDTVHSSGGIPQPHHRIVRIPPGESVVLNSAEHAPYLLLVEILHDELDFDPSKRGNKESLKKIVCKEEERKGASRDLISFATSASPHRHKATRDAHGSEALGKDSVDAPEVPVLGSAIPPTPTSALPPPEVEEEMDLVEQLYGTDQSLRSRPIDLSESIILPPAPKNRDLDMAAWSRPSSVPATPSLEQSSSMTHTPSLSIPGNLRRSVPSSPSAPNISGLEDTRSQLNGASHILSLDEYSERMRTAAVMLAQLNANLVREPVTSVTPSGGNGPFPSSESSGPLSWLPGSSWLSGTPEPSANAGGPIHPSLAGGAHEQNGAGPSSVPTRMRVQHWEASAIRDRIMKEMLALEEERMERMRENREGDGMMRVGDLSMGEKSAEDEGIIRRELNKADPSAVVFSESWAAKKSRIRNGSPYGHLANWDCVSVIVKTGGDLRQEQLAVQLIQEFERIWREEKCHCWVRYFRILITGGTSGLVETITDSVSIHSIKKAEYARRLAEGRLGHVTLFDHFRTTYGDPSSAKFTRAQRNFAQSLAGYSIVTYLLQIKDRHNGNILLDREGHLIHIDFGFMLSNSPGNIGFEAAPFKLPPEYIEVLGGVNSAPFLEFKRLFREGFEAARKHCDRIITLVELMQKDSTLPCFAAFGEQTAVQLRERFQPALTHSLVGEYVDRLIDSSLGSNWTRLYDSYQYYSQSIL